MPAHKHVVTLVIEYDHPMEKEDTKAFIEYEIGATEGHTFEFPDPDQSEQERQEELVWKEAAVKSIRVRSVDEQ